MAEGWICPKCGRALAPWMSECPCNYTKIEITSNFTATTKETGPGMPIYDAMTGNKIPKDWYDHNE